MPTSLTCPPSTTLRKDVPNGLNRRLSMGHTITAKGMSSSSASASIEEFIELLNAEQLVDLQKLRDYARHGVQPAVRGEVWLYLLGVLSDDKSQEMTSVRSKYLEYDSLDKHNVYLEKRIRNESARYYQRKLIARPPPGRTLARSSQRLHSRTYTAGVQRDPNGVLPQTSNSGSAASSSNISTASIAAMNRGPNRVDTGQSRMLAGIMGSSSVLNSSSANVNDEEELLIDPEAAAASEMKRFCMAVENVVCAHLNRWKWKEGKELMKEESPYRASAFNSTSSSSSSSSQKRSISSSSSADHTEKEERKPASPGGVLDGPTTRSRASTASSSSASSTSSRARQGQGTSSSVKAKKSPALFPSLPKEYQWAHQPVEVSATSTLFTLDSATLHGDQLSGQLVEPDYHPDLILLCSPFVKCIRVEAGMYFAFEKLMSMREDYYATHPLASQISTFLTLFRTTLPELHSYFEEEEVDMIGLASAWLRHLLAAEMRIEDLMRLWDTYFAVPDPMDLHMYVCIAILTNCNDALEELDQSETKSMLFSLPPLDVDRILNEAINIRLSHRQSEISHLDR